MPPEVTDSYVENVRRSPTYFRDGLSRPVDPAPFQGTDRPTLVTGSGSSYSMALLMSDLLRRRGRRARAVRPYDLTCHEHLADELVVCISQSGETTDIVDALDRATEAGCPTVGVTAVPESTLGERADHLLEFEPPGEYILSRSCGVLSCLARLLALYRTLGGTPPDGWPSQGIDRVTAAIDDQLSADDGLEVSEEYIFLAGGTLWAVAVESALSVQEAAYRRASASDIKNVAHGEAFRFSEPAMGTFVLLEARDDDEAVFAAAESVLSSLGQKSVRVTSPFEQPWAAPDLLAWSLGFSARLNDSVDLDLANPPGLETVRTLLDQHANPKG